MKDEQKLTAEELEQMADALLEETPEPAKPKKKSSSMH